MADSTRRSGRATKGQHSKKDLEVDEIENAAPKKGSKGRKKNEPTPEEEVGGNDIIRCICGYTVEDEEDDRMMVICEACEAWQHTECMELLENDKELPEEYYCEQCRPKNHIALLTKIKNGEKPWEERARQRELEEEERKARKGKGKRGRKSRASVGKKEDVDTNGVNSKVDREASPNGEVAQADSMSPAAENNKRKLHESSSADAKSPIPTVGGNGQTLDSSLTDSQEPPAKTRKVSSPPAGKSAVPPPSRRKSGGQPPVPRTPTTISNQMVLVENIEDLQHDMRKSAARALSGLFEQQTKQAAKEGTFDLPEGQGAPDFGLKLGLAVEFAIFLNHWGNGAEPNMQYRDQFRAILANVKRNSALRDQILKSEIPPNELSKMSSADMANDELKAKKAEMLKEAEKQHMLIQDDGPRIRRTHKGEELVDDQTHTADGADTAFSAPIRKRPSEIDTTMKDASPEPQISALSPPAAIELPETIPTALPETKPIPATESQASPPPSASKFSMENIFQNVPKRQDSEVQRSQPTPRPPESAVAAIPQQADAEIDRLLKDEEVEDEEPYSPKEANAEPSDGSVWQGKLAMTNVAGFNGKARYSAGADLSETLPWSQLIPDSLSIDGRIDIERASAYLCGLKWSHTSDVVVISITPSDNPHDISQFNKLFKYFTERNRYGVGGRNANDAVRDTYVVPLERGASYKSIDFISLLDTCHIQDPTPDRLLLVTFVVKQLGNSPSHQTPRPIDAASMASPIGATASTNPVPQNPGTHPGYQGTPTPLMAFPPPGYPQYSGSPMQGQGLYTPPQSMPPYAAPSQSSLSYTGMQAAQHVLGDLAHCPAVTDLLKEAPRSSVVELNVVKAILERDQESRTDYPRLRETMVKQLHARVQG